MRWSEEQQRLAVAVALLLTVGGALLGEALIGPWLTLAVGAAIALFVVVVPWTVRAVTFRRFVKQLRRYEG